MAQSAYIFEIRPHVDPPPDVQADLLMRAIEELITSASPEQLQRIAARSAFSTNLLVAAASSATHPRIELNPGLASRAAGITRISGVGDSPTNSQDMQEAA
jgi:hypothetical protein